MPPLPPVPSNLPPGGAGGPPAVPPLRLTRVSKSFPSPAGPVPVLENVDLTLPPGSFSVLLGPSGSGKTTLLSIAALLSRPDIGSVAVAGVPLDAASPRDLDRLRARSLGIVFQRFHLLPRRSALDNVLFRFRYAPLPASRARSLALEALDRVGLASLASRPAGLLSAGEMQRVAIARAVALPPVLLLADEPTGNLDSDNAARIADLFLSLHASGISVLLATHDLSWTRLPPATSYRMADRAPRPLPPSP
jgi:putative ABC transport system ATP-binding protein